MSEQSSYCPFVVGQHVVCVDASETEGRRWMVDPHPEQGAVYTVSRVFWNYFRHSAAVMLAGLPDNDGDGYRASRFRPAPSIAALTELLNKAPVKEDAHV